MSQITYSFTKVGLLLLFYFKINTQHSHQNNMQSSIMLALT